MARILTGGCGFILAAILYYYLLKENHELIVFDNFSTSSPIIIKRVIKLAKRGRQKKIFI